MAKTAQCPACGAAVVFKSAASLYAVCEYCRSTLVRHDKELKNIGRMADLLEDASPIWIGTEGRYKGVHFAVIGRIQLRYEAGVWNEWHLLFDDMRGGWLSDANGEYALSFLAPVKESLPEFSALAPEMPLTLAGKPFVVTDIEEALCIAGEGELPFAFGAGHAAPVADLRGDKLFATIDYSEARPLVFIGAILPFEAFQFSNLRGAADNPFAAQPNLAVKSLQCPQCGGPIAIHTAATRSVACPACLTLLDAENDSLAILAKAAAMAKIEPMLALGSSGKFGGQGWTVIGFMRRCVRADGEEFFWDEYLLHHSEQGLRWLTEDRGHWGWAVAMSSPPPYRKGTDKIVYEKEIFKRFVHDWAETVYVVGEFNWRVTVGERWEIEDFVAPPRMLSREVNEREATWSSTIHLESAEVTAAFQLEPDALPAAAGVGALQPNPRIASHRVVCRRFWAFALLATLLQFVWINSGDGGIVHSETLTIPRNADEALETREFDLPRGVRRLMLRQTSDLDNDWIGLDITLVDARSGQNWQTRRELSYWSGIDGGESWSEGSRGAENVFRDVPAGRYRFIVDPEFSNEVTFGSPPPAANKPVRLTVEVERNAAIMGNYALLMLFLIVFPLITRYRIMAFESRRWAESEFNPYKADDSDGDGGDD